MSRIGCISRLSLESALTIALILSSASCGDVGMFINVWPSVLTKKAVPPATENFMIPELLANVKQAPVPVGSGVMLGLCLSCNKPLAKSSRRKYCSDKCRQKHFYDDSKAKNGMPYKKFMALQPKARYKAGSRTKLAGGVSSDGVRYLTHITVGA